MAAALFGIGDEEWGNLPKGDWRKGLVASLIRQRALVRNGWVAARLGMGATGAVSRTIREAKEFTARDRNARSLARELVRNVKTF